MCVIKSSAFQSYGMISKGYYQSSLKMKVSDVIRPSLDDVEKISFGQAAKKRGTGSRAVPHRLNADERVEWDYAKKKRFVVLRGSGWRKERGDSPLANVYRLYCDAVAIPTISVRRGQGVDVEDEVLIDFSTLRQKDFSGLVQQCKLLCSEIASCTTTDDFSDMSLLGWADNVDEVYDSYAIWRIPSLHLSIKFNNRNDAKVFAASIAQKLAGGENI